MVRGREARKIPVATSRNYAGPPALEMIRRANSHKGLEIRIEKRVPVGIGIGSSGATAAACVKAIDSALGLSLSDQTLVQIASLGEKAVAGSPHADNVAASLLGGFVIVYGGWPPRSVSCELPPNLEVVVTTPKVPVPRNKTRMARSLVPESARMGDVVLNLGRASAMAAGFTRGDFELVREAMEDALIEPHRQKLIPGYSDVKRGALSSGAFGVAISGAGPSVIALVDHNRCNSRLVARAMVRAFSRHRIQSAFFVSRPGQGARIVQRE